MTHNIQQYFHQQSSNSNAGNVLIGTGSGVKWVSPASLIDRMYNNSLKEDITLLEALLFVFDSYDSEYIQKEHCFYGMSFIKEIEDYISKSEIYRDMDRLHKLYHETRKFILSNGINELKNVPEEIIILYKLQVLK